MMLTLKELLTIVLLTAVLAVGTVSLVDQKIILSADSKPETSEFKDPTYLYGCGYFCLGKENAEKLYGPLFWVIPEGVADV